MSGNESYGIHRIFEAELEEEAGNESYNGTEMQELESEFSQVFLEGMAGGYEMAGVMALAFVGYGLYRNDVSMDVSFTVLMPMTLLLAIQGFLPLGEGIIFGLLIVATGLGFVGAYKYMAR